MDKVNRNTSLSQSDF